MTERRFQMIRVGTGDWLLPSNDQRRLWRLHSYEDGSDYGLVDVRYQHKTFWRAVWIPMPLVRGVPTLTIPDLPDDRWGKPWIEADWNLPSRQAAIALALAHDEERPLVTVTPPV